MGPIPQYYHKRHHKYDHNYDPKYYHSNYHIFDRSVQKKKTTVAQSKSGCYPILQTLALCQDSSRDSTDTDELASAYDPEDEAASDFDPEDRTKSER